MSSEYPWGKDDLVNRRNLNEKMFPAGGIILWSGSVEEIPLGWALCDGQNGTPDLRGRFIVGAGSTYALGDNGGEEKHTLTVAEMPSHTHQIPVFDQGGNSGGTGYPMVGSNLTPAKYTAAVGNSQPHNNLPPYYALCYIMRL